MKIYVMSVAATVLFALSCCTNSFAIDFDVPGQWDTRLISGSDNSRDDNNGGLDNLLIGRNTGGVDNYVIYSFDLSSLAGQILDGDSTVTIGSTPNWTNGNHGSPADTIEAREIFATNAGWIEGGRTIGGGDNQTDAGEPSYLNRVQYNDDPGTPSGTTEPWKDAAGTDVANVVEASSLIDSLPGFAPAAANPDGVQLEFTVPQATAQSWIDDGFGGILLRSIDADDDRARFNFSNGGSAITFSIVPEPSTAVLLFIAATGFLARSKS